MTLRRLCIAIYCLGFVLGSIGFLWTDPAAQCTKRATTSR